MVEKTDAPPERLYRPDISLIAWRRLCERGDGRVDPDAAVGGAVAAPRPEELPDA
jgi:hypothetical protein